MAMQTIEGTRPTDGDRPHIWLQEDGGHATASALVQTSTPAEAGKAIVPFETMAAYPFSPGPVEAFWSKRTAAVMALYAVFFVACTCLWFTLAWGVFGGGFTILVGCIAALVALFIGRGFRALMCDISEARSIQAVHSYLRTSGWTSDGSGASLTWYRDLGLGVGLLQLKCEERGRRIWGVCGQCHQRDFEQLAANLHAIDPGLTLNTDYGCYGLAVIDLAAPPREDARLDELGYGQSGWIGEGAILSRLGDPAFAEYITGMIHRKAFVRQTRDAEHNVLVYVAFCTGAGVNSLTLSVSRIDEAGALAVARARAEGAPAGTLIAVVKLAYREEKTPAMLLTLEEEGAK